MPGVGEKGAGVVVGHEPQQQIRLHLGYHKVDVNTAKNIRVKDPYSFCTDPDPA